MVPANFDPANHIFPEGIINSTGEAEQLIVVAAVRRRVPESAAGSSVFHAPVQLQLLGCLIHQVKGVNIGVVVLERKSVRVIVRQPNLQIGEWCRRGCADVDTRLVAGSWTARERAIGSIPGGAIQAIDDRGAESRAA